MPSRFHRTSAFHLLKNHDCQRRKPNFREFYDNAYMIKAYPFPCISSKVISKILMSKGGQVVDTSNSRMMFSCKLYLTLEVEYSSINSVLRSPQATVLDPPVSSDLQVKSVSVLPCGLCTPPILYRLSRSSYSNLNDPLPPQCDLWWSFWWSSLLILSRALVLFKS